MSKLNKVSFAIIIHKVSPNSEDLVREITKRGHLVDYLFFDSILNHNSKLEIILRNKKRQRINDNNFDLLIWRDTETRAIIRKIVANYFRQKGKIFIDKIWATRDWTANKLRQVEFFFHHGLPVPKTLFLSNFSTRFKNSPHQLFKKITSSLGIPFVAKPIVGSKGNNIFLIKKEKEFQQLEQKFCDLSGRNPLFQEYLSNNGDFRALLINKKFIGAYKRIPKEGEFRANIAQGGKGEKVTPEKELISLSKKVAEIMGIEILGVDIIQDQKCKKYYVVETNGIPQWQGFKKTTGINVAQEIIDYCLSLL